MLILGDRALGQAYNPHIPDFSMPWVFHTDNTSNLTVMGSSIRKSEYRESNSSAMSLRHELAWIADFLFKQRVPSPRDGERRTRSVIRDVLYNQKYIDCMSAFDASLLT